MSLVANCILIVKYIVAIITLVVIVLTPAYLAAKNEKDKLSQLRIRAASWLFGWTGIGWLLALFWAVRK
ncbi:MAG: superinfection immunity protein [Alphaproteobacteria bacterium]|nr:superinfection immunity protein [Alphaproteobacteria bacterium]